MKLKIKMIFRIAFLVGTAFFCGCKELNCTKNDTSLVSLEVNRLSAPSNVGKAVFSWKMVSDRQNARQKSYRIVVKESLTGNVVWDTGFVNSDVSVGVAYSGQELKSAFRYLWKVSVLDEQDQLSHAESSFVTGLLSQSQWDGSKWIGVAGFSGVPTKEQKSKEISVPGTSCLVKELELGDGIVEAMWTVTGLGVFEAYVNGVRVGNDFLKPGFTNALKTRHAFTYDVTELLSKNGKTVLAAEVSAGWWRDKITGYLGKNSAFRSQLIVRYRDGSERRFGTDESWSGAIGGQIQSASIFEGELLDARVSEGWKISIDRESFKPVAIVDEFKGKIIPIEGPAVTARYDLTLKPVEAYVWKDAELANANQYGKVKKLRIYKKGDSYKLFPGEKLVVDFGQNAAAVPRFRIKASAGQRIVFYPAEMLNDEMGLKSRGNDGPEGSVYRLNLRTIHKTGARATYIASGVGEEVYMPRFTFFGYRYASIETSAPVEICSIESIPVTSISKSLERGRIETGLPDVNKLVSNILWGQYSNYLSVPTDCPQRNERLGWSADTQVFSVAATFNADVYGFLSKWMRDMRDSQRPDGAFPGVAPLAQYGNSSHELGWSDAGIIVPYNMWKIYADRTIIEDNWDAMVTFLDSVQKVRYTNSASCQHHQWADWLSFEAYETCSGKANGLNLKGEARKEAVRRSRLYWKYLGGCYWLIDARMMKEMAEVLGKTESVRKYSDMEQEALNYIRQEFVGADGLLPEFLRPLQTPALFALKLGILEKPSAIDETKTALLKNIEDHGGCLQTGFLGTSIIMDTLTDNVKRPDAAYSLLLQRKNPSWLYSVDQGATTIWERWDSYVKSKGFGVVSMNSFNHYAYGVVLSWLYRTVAGIREGKCGYKDFVLSPIPDRRIGSVKAQYDSPYGVITSSWKYEKSGLWIWNFTIPANSSATVVYPDGAIKRLGAGSYSCCIDLDDEKVK